MESSQNQDNNYQAQSKMSFFVILLILINHFLSGNAESSNRSISVCEHNLTYFLSKEGISPPEKGSGNYEKPSQTILTHLKSSIFFAINGNWPKSIPHALLSDYKVCLLKGDPNIAIWVPSKKKDGEATIILRLKNYNPLVLEFPHPFFDGVLSQAQILFNKTRAFALIVSGTHRCASKQPTKCTGKTRVCTGEKDKYPVSDVAHNEENSFHAAHLAISQNFLEGVVVSIHGTGREIAYISDGSKGFGERNNLVSKVANNLSKIFPKTEIRSCDLSGPSTKGWLCGSGNVQGRHINGSKDACLLKAENTNGKFLHIEQPKELRDNPIFLGEVLRDAIGR